MAGLKGHPAKSSKRNLVLYLVGTFLFLVIVVHIASHYWLVRYESTKTDTGTGFRPYQAADCNLEPDSVMCTHMPGCMWLNGACASIAQSGKIIEEMVDALPSHAIASAATADRADPRTNSPVRDAAPAAKSTPAEKAAVVTKESPAAKRERSTKYVLDGEFSWEQSQKYCEQQGETLCDWTHYCPDGEKSTPAAGKFEDEDLWAPIADNYNDWVQLGTRTADWLCKKSQGFFTTLGVGPNWGLERGCCMKKNGVRQSPFLCCDPGKVKKAVKKTKQQDRLKREEAERSLAQNVPPGKGKDTTMHVVFSTGCTPYQNWQAEALLFSWKELNHAGQITRITSGCKSDADKRKVLSSPFAEGEDRVHFYFTPDFTSTDPNGRKFFYTNKGSGMDHWFKNSDITEDVIILLDPDMVIMKEFDFERYPVSEGFPRGQIYGYGSRWMEWGICDVPSCTKMSRREAEDRYTVGPPYILHREDWRKLLPEWVRFNALSLIHEPASKSNLAEMYGYSVAAAFLELKHERSQNHMISDPGTPRSMEAWGILDFSDDGYLDTLPFEYLHYPHRFWLMKDKSLPPNERTYIDSHYYTGGWNWHKGHVPPNILTDCDIPLLHELPWDQREELRLKDPWVAKDPKRNKEPRYHWMLHQLIPRVNKGILHYKKKNCGEDWNMGKLVAMMQPNHGGQHRSQASYLVNVTWEETQTYPQ